MRKINKVMENMENGDRMVRNFEGHHT